MHLLKTLIKKSFIMVSIITLIGGLPMGVSAQSDDSSPQSAEKTEEKNEDLNYRYNEETGRWDSDAYIYDPNTNSYVPTPVSQKVSNQTPAQTSTPSSSVSQTTSQTGPSSNNQQENNTNTNTKTNVNNTVGVNNAINGSATTGNGLVSGNTKADSALSGDAQSIANILNILQSSTNTGDDGMITFQQDITGDVVGDMIINPELIFNLGPGSANVTENNVNGESSVNVNTEAEINNEVVLAATSGNASAIGNTEVGDAKSGNAYVMANVVNVLNSVISANKSFLGMINIYGNLDGDILFPPETINKLLTSNVPTANVSLNNVTGEVELNNNQAINNNINLDANSGNANVSNNTSAGSATTGSAKTNMTVLNLTGSEIIASNSILVFVNVLGNWVGMIMNAPNGATAAALGGGVTSATNNTNVDSETNVNNNATINNNLNLSANTGDATVSSNTQAGSATTGDAYVAANVANVNNSSLSLSNWFGLMFINVFGSWNGSFGIDTEAGNRSSIATGGFGSGSTTAQQKASVPTVFNFIPVEESATNAGQENQFVVQVAAQTTNSGSSVASITGTGQSGSGGQSGGGTEALSQATKDNNQSVLMFTGIGVLLGVTLLGAERIVSFIQQRRGSSQIFAGTGAVSTSDDI